MEFQLLYDFLKSGKTQKAFAEECKISSSAMASKLTRQLQKLERTKIITLEEYVKNKNSILIVEVRSKRDMWRRAIEAYNEAIKSLAEQKSYPFSIEEIKLFRQWFDTMKGLNPQNVGENDEQLNSKLQSYLKSKPTEFQDITQD